ncbi:hypothetical protein [Streptomyces sp. NPDC002676]
MSQPPRGQEGHRRLPPPLRRFRLGQGGVDVVGFLGLARTAAESASPQAVADLVGWL